MSFPPQFPLAHRKALCGRSMFLEALAPTKVDIADAGTLPELDLLRKHVFNLTTDAISKSADTTRLDEFLLKFVDSLAEVNHALDTGTSDRKLVGELLSTLRASVDRISCENCSPFKVRVCNGQSTDDEIVSRGGQCISNLSDTFSFVVNAVKQVYSENSGSFRELPSLEVLFSTAPCIDKPHDIPVECFVSGATTYSQNGATNVSVVELQLATHKFDWKTYLAIFYVIFHECMCHVFQSPYFGLEIAEPNCYFAEGWMDWVAYEMSSLLLPNSGSGVRFAESKLETAGEFHRARVDFDRYDASEFAKSRALGKAAAQRLLFLLERLPESYSGAWNGFLELSLELSFLKRSQRDKDRFVAILARHLPSRDDAIELPSHFYPVPYFVRKYMQNRDLNDLFNAVLALA